MDLSNFRTESLILPQVGKAIFSKSILPSFFHKVEMHNMTSFIRALPGAT